MEVKIGDIVYVIRNKMKNHKNAGYYIDKCRVCDLGCSYHRNKEYVYVDHNFGENDDIPSKRGKRMYLLSRIYKDIKEAQKECDFKNKSIEIREEYKNKLSKIKNEDSEINKKLQMNISAITVMECQRLLDYLVEKDTYLAQIGDLNIRYEGVIEDTLIGKRQVFHIVRKIKEE